MLTPLSKNLTSLQYTHKVQQESCLNFKMGRVYIPKKINASVTHKQNCVLTSVGHNVEFDRFVSKCVETYVESICIVIGLLCCSTMQL